MYAVRLIDQEEVPFRFGLYLGSKQVGKVDFHIEQSVPDDSWLGDLPPSEMFLAGLELPWDEDWFLAGTGLLREAIAALPEGTPSVLQANTNLEVHEHSLRRIHLFEALGFELFQEKHGYLWVDQGEPLNGTLETTPVAEAGEDAYRMVLSRIPSGGLDRNDNYYYGATGADNWAMVMMSMAKPEDLTSWLIGSHNGETIGLVGLSAFDEPATGTVAYIGVLPEHRGHGYGRQLLMAITAAGRERGFTQILSDVDVLNTPMRTAMVACGHQPHLRPWHKWAYWLRLRT